MNARDVMTTEVVSVNSDTPTQQIAGLFLEKGIHGPDHPIPGASRSPSAQGGAASKRVKP